ncbi:MAG: sugar nucleotide-binding protein [Thermoproteota archaeon]|nr:sugar nucleotide-binding protein [Thermoproteota archaeon]
MLRTLQLFTIRQKIDVITDHYNTPTLTNNLAQVIGEAVEKDLNGLYHASGAERISRYHFAEKIAQKFNLAKNQIKPTKMKNLENSGTWLAKRPPDSSLETSKIQNQITTKLFNVNEALEAMKKEETDAALN